MRYPQAAYSGLVMSLQAEWKYLHKAVPGVGGYMGLIEEAPENNFLPKLLGLYRIAGSLRDLLSLGSNR